MWSPSVIRLLSGGFTWINPCPNGDRTTTHRVHHTLTSPILFRCSYCFKYLSMWCNSWSLWYSDLKRLFFHFPCHSILRGRTRNLPTWRECQSHDDGWIMIGRAFEGNKFGHYQDCMISRSDARPRHQGRTGFPDLWRRIISRPIWMSADAGAIRQTCARVIAKRQAGWRTWF